METGMETRLNSMQAADLLLVSHEYLRDLLNSGALPFTGSAEAPQLSATDVLAYKQQTDARRRLALEALVAQAQELGMG